MELKNYKATAASFERKSRIHPSSNARTRTNWSDKEADYRFMMLLPTRIARSLIIAHSAAGTLTET